YRARRILEESSPAAGRYRPARLPARGPSVTRKRPRARSGSCHSQTRSTGVSLWTCQSKEVQMKADTQDLVFTLDDRVATLTVNRPDRLNPLSDTIIDPAVAALRRCATDPEVGAVLVTGAGRAFCAGGDVSAMGTAGAAPRTFEDHVDRQHEMHALSWLLATIPKGTIAAGDRAGGGGRPRNSPLAGLWLCRRPAPRAPA